MLRLYRNPVNDAARLKCDECRRLSSIQCFGLGPIRNPDAARDWLRKMCRCVGWSTIPSIESGQIDLCRRCTDKLGRML